MDRLGLSFMYSKQYNNNKYRSTRYRNDNLFRPCCTLFIWLITNITSGAILLFLDLKEILIYHHVKFVVYCPNFKQSSSHSSQIILYKEPFTDIINHQYIGMDRPAARLNNSLQNYDFLETGASSIKSKKNISNKNNDLDIFANDVCDASDIHMIVKQKFSKTEYPQDLVNANIFCPLCGKIINQAEQFSSYESESYKRCFLAHDLCLSNQSNRLLNDVFDNVEQMIYIPKEREAKPSVLAVGRQFCLDLTISHPLSDFKFVKLVNKCQLQGNLLRWILRKDEQQDLSNYEPNIICFPLIDFKVSLIISQIGSQYDKKIVSVYVNLSRAKLNTSKIFVAQTNQISLQFHIHSTTKEKEEVISEMNYKYRYPEKLNLPIVQLQSLEVEITQEKYKEDNEEQVDDYDNSNSINNLLSEDFNGSSVASSFNIYSLNKNYHQNSFYDDSSKKKLAFDSDQYQDGKFSEKSSIAEKQKVQFEHLIATGKLSSYVRNAAQSRNFQKFLSEATHQQVDLIIKILIDQFSDLVVNDYANYMTQKLFQVSNPTQRLIILQKLYPEIPNLVRNKQGTHTIQAFLCQLMLKQEIKLIIKSIKSEFDDLCFHPTSTHFIQKLIKTFDIQDTIQFFQYANKHFLRFATDKNAMCVLKYMLRRVDEFKDKPITSEIRKHFINSITLNTHKIIQDCYGNYVIQFCYELFGQTKSSGITEMILQKFVQFSLQRYSSTVVSKCIGTYWTDRSYALKLKDSLNGEGILEMYRNKEGNKILLDLMDRNQNSSLRQKIYNYLASTGQSSKFYHERWDMQKGIKSGPVGFQFKSFTEAFNQQQRSYNPGTGSRKSKKK